LLFGSSFDQRSSASICGGHFLMKKRGKGAYMISAVAEMYDIHPQTLRLYEREGLLKPSRTEGNTRLYTDDDLKRLEFILELARDYGVNISGIDMILRMRENMELMRHQMDLMQQQMQEFLRYLQTEMIRRSSGHEPSAAEGALVPMRRSLAVPVPNEKKNK
jgi:MerR family transcriptional regulator/heat shock protein HspR